ncbi:DUF305 domain-containing protein (plasmid) [Citricoccus sp. SGAir0253]|uniref:DUF305 domain-containing protein n=1 Tax=Citricoccus sp. SGAir0253 TaxID=2567881 RepID=UPI0010CCD413|nr:DUF305 domain-containing protein [Citricoccus sp. SGAir0253]QCU79716.1 DUF305 domain-containing protein [Citricoccus sp. SGAir0253]
MKHTTTLSALALAAALALTACGNTEGGGDGGTETPPAPAATTSTPAATTAEASPTATDTAIGTTEEISAEHNDKDIMFAQMMIPHHQQAVQMSEMLLAKEDIPADVADFAQEVIDAQGPEIERMDAMLAAWGEEAVGMEDMGSMDDGSGQGMSGMMSEEDMMALDKAKGTEAARLYLEQMTAHHEGAVEMAQEQLDAGQNPQAKQLAQQVVDAQKAEIEEMGTMLQDLPAS